MRAFPFYSASTLMLIVCASPATSISSSKDVFPTFHLIGKGPPPPQPAAFPALREWTHTKQHHRPSIPVIIYPQQKFVLPVSNKARPQPTQTSNEHLLGPTPSPTIALVPPMETLSSSLNHNRSSSSDSITMVELRPMNSTTSSAAAPSPSSLPLRDTIDHSSASIIEKRPGVFVSDTSAIALMTVKRHMPKIYWDLLHLCFSKSDEKVRSSKGLGLNAVFVSKVTHTDSNLERWQMIEDIRSINSEVRQTVAMANLLDRTNLIPGINFEEVGEGAGMLNLNMFNALIPLYGQCGVTHLQPITTTTMIPKIPAFNVLLADVLAQDFTTSVSLSLSLSQPQ